jgi:uncharacterized protein YqgV (UPF0045/DUF77 family)
MTVSAQIAIYPLRQKHLTAAVEAVQQALRDRGLQAEQGPMSTYVVGEDEAVFAALRDAFAQASAAGHVVMAVTVSNACPIPD